MYSGLRPSYIRIYESTVPCAFSMTYIISNHCDVFLEGEVGGGGYRGGLLNSMRNRKSVINEANDIFQNFIYFLIHSYLNNQC